MLQRGVRRRISAVIVAAIGAVGLTGCQGPDLSGRADVIGAVLSAKPGVEDVKTQYQNGFDSGRSITYIVKMAAGATTAQSVEVAAALDQETGDEFDLYDQDLRLLLSGRVVEISDLTSSDIMADRASHLLALSSELSVSRLEWRQASEQTTFDDALELSETQEDIFGMVNAVRAELGSEQFELRARDSAMTEWDVAFPYSEQAQGRLETAVEPHLGQVKKVAIDDSQVSRLSVVVPDGVDVVSRLRGIIERIDSADARPWEFDWALGSDPTGAVDPSTKGSVNVAGCEYNEDPDRQMTSAAQTTQDQLRRIYDTCS
ncbi:hypothetical protein D3I60_05865 [Brevibacterium permense]|nr:hypothetical protein [Brevibacterium permense]